MNELEEKEAEKVKEFIGEIENRVNKMLEEIKEVRKVISKWKSVEHVGWKLGIKPKKENSIKKIISENISEIMKRIDDEINRLKPILKEFRSNKNVKKN